MSGNVAFPPSVGDSQLVLSDRHLTVGQAATAVQLSEDSIRRAYTAGHLKVERFGARLQCVRVRESELNRWLASGGRTR